MTATDVIAGRAYAAVEAGNAPAFLAGLPAGRVHCCVTSPPYYGLRDYGVEGQIGLEDTPEAFVARLVDVFRGVRRALHPSGTLWVNMGDSYAANGRYDAAYESKRERAAINGGGRELAKVGEAPRKGYRGNGVKAKDLIGVPWLLAFALRADGWYLRSEVIWHKPNPMPESVTDRPGRTHEQVFLLSKSPAYFYDAQAVAERAAASSGPRLRQDVASQHGSTRANGGAKTNGPMRAVGSPDSRNLRTVWRVPVARFKGAHFATFPERLVRPCVLAGTSAKGCCPACFAPWVRVVEKKRTPTRPGADTKATGESLTDGNRDPRRHVTAVETVGWEPGCGCGAGEPAPCIVLDPFAGSGTTLAVAKDLGRRAVGCDLNPRYVALARRRLSEVTPAMV